ncbi:MAG TPA: histidine phosphatase family protein [Acetobacteraceae bacterium]
MTIVHFITHPEVSIDAAVPVPDWPLSPVGSRRMQVAMRQPWLAAVRSVFCSAERKAMDAAAVVANHLGLRRIVVEALGENDRSATGYLPKGEFEAVADAFFAQPDDSVRGWERARDAQRRIVDAVERAISMSVADGDVAIVSHGGVGTLFLCHLKGVAISRSEDQPGEGGGNFFSFDAADRHLLSEWRPIEA